MMILRNPVENHKIWILHRTSKSHVSNDHPIVKTLYHTGKKEPFMLFCRRSETKMIYCKELHKSYGFLLIFAEKLWLPALEICFHDEVNFFRIRIE